MLQSKKTLKFVIRMSVLLLLVLTIYVNYHNLLGAFGNVPPYYGKSTNMDKWTNPVPYLIAMNVVVTILATIFWRFSNRLDDK